MKQEQEQEVYATSFPSGWLGAASSLPSRPAEHDPASDPRPSNDTTSDDAQRVRVEIDETDNDSESDATLGYRESVSSRSTTSRGSEDGKYHAINNIHRTKLTGLNPRRRVARAAAIVTPENDYTTVYPASWTISSARDTKQASPAVASKSGPPAKTAPSMAQCASIRSISTTSQGDVGPISPTRRRIQRNFLSMSHPSPRSEPPPTVRAASVHVPVSQPVRMERFPAHKPDMTGYMRTALQNAPRVDLSLYERHTSSTSNYSTIEKAPSQRDWSKADTPASHRNLSAVYSGYDDDK